MSASTFPKCIDLNQLNDAFIWQGDIEFSRFSRLVKEVEDSQISAKVSTLKPITLDCTLSVSNSSLDDDFIWLTMTASGELPQQCQRCMNRVDTLMHVDLKLALLTDETLTEQLDDDADFIVLDETHGLASKTDRSDNVRDALSVDLLSIIEDELLLTLPISPKHDDCDMAVSQVGDIPEEATPQDNPFAQLAELKGKLNKEK